MALGVLLAIIVLLVLAQLLLPGIAASRIRSRLERYGSVQNVTVTAFPAVELLWGRADTVHVKARSLVLSSAQTARLLEETRAAGSVSATAMSLKEGRVQLRDASLQKHGVGITAEAFATETELKSGLGEGFEVQPLSSGGGQVQVSVAGALFGIKAAVNAVIAPEEGSLVLHPTGFLLDALQLTLFASPHVRVEGVGASPARESSSGVAGYRVSARASVR